MPRPTLLGPGSPVLVAGSIGWVMGSGSGHQPSPRRQASGHATTPGRGGGGGGGPLHRRSLRAAHFEGHGAALLVAIAAPRLPRPHVRGGPPGPRPGRQSSEATVLDLALPGRVKPAFSFSPSDPGQLPAA